jgi:DNA-binding protein H-NS
MPICGVCTGTDAGSLRWPLGRVEGMTHAPDGQLRIGHAERDAAVAQLRDAAAEGRLTLEELDVRIETVALGAHRTRDEAADAAGRPAAAASSSRRRSTPPRLLVDGQRAWAGVGRTPWC